MTARIAHCERERTPMKIKLLFAWYDLWVGAFYDRKGKRLYILPLPCVGIVIQFKRTFFEEVAEQSTIALWQSYCNVKMERDALKEQIAEGKSVAKGNDSE